MVTDSFLYDTGHEPFALRDLTGLRTSPSSPKRSLLFLGTQLFSLLYRGGWSQQALSCDCMTSLFSFGYWLRGSGLLTQARPTRSFSAVVSFKLELGWGWGERTVIMSLVGTHIFHTVREASWSWRRKLKRERDSETGGKRGREKIRGEGRRGEGS